MVFYETGNRLIPADAVEVLKPSASSAVLRARNLRNGTIFIMHTFPNAAAATAAYNALKTAVTGALVNNSVIVISGL